MSYPPPNPSKFHKRALEFAPREPAPAPRAANVVTVRGIQAQRVGVNSGITYDFRWVGKKHFIVFNDLRMRDGETHADDHPVSRRKDARGTFSYVPGGCRIWGWTAPECDDDSFLAMYLDPATLDEELGSRLQATTPRPGLFFAAPELVATFGKLHRALRDDEPLDAMYAESLCLVAATEFCRHRERHGADGTAGPAVGATALSRIEEYIQTNLANEITLDELARLAGLSRFHFLRSFRAATGETPYQRVVKRRIERAQLLLASRELSVAEVATRVGYKSASRFIAAFRRACGFTPGLLAPRRGLRS